MTGDKTTLTVHHARSPAPAQVPALAKAHEEARAAGLALVALSHTTSPEALKALAKRRHDLKAAMRTLGFTVKALETGYKFADDKAAAKIDAIAKAVAVLEQETTLMADLLATD